MYLDNNWYGDRFILSKYCKVKDKPAFASIQHGHLTIKNYKSNTPLGTRKLTLTPWLVWNNKISEYAKKKNIKNVIPIGSVLLYLEKNILNSTKIKPKGTLFFPFLSHPEEKMINDYDKIVSFLKKNFPPPYTISVSLHDLKNINKIYKSVKFCSFGLRGNKNYLKKLYLEIQKHSDIICSYPGSPLMYSMYLKKKIFLSKSYFLKNLSNKKKKQLAYTIKIMLKDLSKYGIDIKNLNNKKNKINIKSMMGNKFIKSPKELRSILGWNSNLKIFMAKIFSKLIDFKEDIRKGFNYSNLVRTGKNYSSSEYKSNTTSGN
jgi:hypothetical protein